jgi:hypothetical protein
MLKAGGQGMDLHPHYRPSVLSPSDDFATHIGGIRYPHRAGDGICADLHFRIGGMIVTAGPGPATATRIAARRGSFVEPHPEGVHIILQYDGGARAAAEAVNKRTATTSPESIRPVGTTAV